MSGNESLTLDVTEWSSNEYIQYLQERLPQSTLESTMGTDNVEWDVTDSLVPSLGQPAAAEKKLCPLKMSPELTIGKRIGKCVSRLLGTRNR